MAQTLDIKDPTESVSLTFDFSLGLASGVTLSGTPTVTATVHSGTAPSPSAILAGGNSIVGSTVLVPVTAGIAGVDYEVKVVCSTTDVHTILALAAVLPVRSI